MSFKIRNTPKLSEKATNRFNKKLKEKELLLSKMLDLKNMNRG